MDQFRKFTEFCDGRNPEVIYPALLYRAYLIETGQSEGVIDENMLKKALQWAGDSAANAGRAATDSHFQVAGGGTLGGFPGALAGGTAGAAIAGGLSGGMLAPVGAVVGGLGGYVAGSKGMSKFLRWAHQKLGGGPEGSDMVDSRYSSLGKYYGGGMADLGKAGSDKRFGNAYNKLKGRV